MLNKEQLDLVLNSYLSQYSKTTNEAIAIYIKHDLPDIGISLVNLRKLLVIAKKQNKLLFVPNFVIPNPVTDGHFTVVIGCSHIPFHLQNMWDATCQLTNWLSSRVTTDFVADGDILDMNSISRHAKGKVAKQPGLTLGKEYQLASAEFDKIDWTRLRNKTYLYGNHEAWYSLHMQEVDNAKLGEGAVKSPTEGLKLVERGFTVLTRYGQDKHTIGDLLVVHGYLVNKHSAMAHLETYKQNVLFYHTHRMQTYTDSGPNNTQITAYNGGFGGDRSLIAFNYMDEGSKRKWKNAIAVTYTNELGHTTVTLVEWIDNRFVFMGHEFTATGVKILLNN